MLLSDLCDIYLVFKNFLGGEKNIDHRENRKKKKRVNKDPVAPIVCYCLRN
jgi:hypothetical protein